MLLIGIHLPLGGLDGIFFLRFCCEVGIFVLDGLYSCLVAADSLQLLCFLSLERGKAVLQGCILLCLLQGGRSGNLVHLLLGVVLVQLEYLLVILVEDNLHVGTGLFSFFHLHGILPVKLNHLEVVFLLTAFLNGCEAVLQVYLCAVGIVGCLRLGDLHGALLSETDAQLLLFGAVPLDGVELFLVLQAN